MDARENAGNLRYRATLQVLRTADTFWNISRAFFQKWDLSPSQFNVLNLLDTEPQGLSQTELSRQLIMHRSNVTGLVDRLEKRGMVDRRDVASDRRAYRVVLSPAGAALLRQILPEYHRRAEAVWEGLSTPRVKAVMRDLATATEHADQAGKPL
jgi:DNA-binding MarR family transcriptional regulator